VNRFALVEAFLGLPPRPFQTRRSSSFSPARKMIDRACCAHRFSYGNRLPAEVGAKYQSLSVPSPRPVSSPRDRYPSTCNRSALAVLYFSSRKMDRRQPKRCNSYGPSRLHPHFAWPRLFNMWVGLAFGLPVREELKLPPLERLSEWTDAFRDKQKSSGGQKR
jgi:hypothetical protein